MLSLLGYKKEIFIYSFIFLWSKIAQKAGGKTKMEQTKILHETEYVQVKAKERKTDGMTTFCVSIWDRKRAKFIHVNIRTFYDEPIKGMGLDIEY